MEADTRLLLSKFALRCVLFSVAPGGERPRTRRRTGEAGGKVQAMKVAEMEVSGGYLPTLSLLLRPGTSLAAPDPCFPNAALTPAPLLLYPSSSIQVLPGGILGEGAAW